jgi:hypothetical protein
LLRSLPGFALFLCLLSLGFFPTEPCRPLLLRGFPLSLGRFGLLSLGRFGLLLLSLHCQPVRPILGPLLFCGSLLLLSLLLPLLLLYALRDLSGNPSEVRNGNAGCGEHRQDSPALHGSAFLEELGLRHPAALRSASHRWEKLRRTSLIPRLTSWELRACVLIAV